MGRIGEQPQGQILPTDCGRQAPVARGGGKLESDGRRDWRHFERRAGGVMKFRRRARFESEMDAEMRFHIESYAEDLMRAGVSREEAMRRARIEFGGLNSHKEDCRASLGMRLWDELGADLRFGLRM